MPAKVGLTGKGAVLALPAAIIWVPAGVEPRLAGRMSVALTTYPRLLLLHSALLKRGEGIANR